jgi:hypothetical protein
MDGSQLKPSRVSQGSLWTGEASAPHWHPDIARFFLYWRSIAPASGLPGRRHLEPLDIAPLLPGIWLVDVQPEPFRLRYRLVGTEAVEAIGAEVTGRWMDEAHPMIAENPGYLDRYRAVCEHKIPSWRRGIPQLWVNKQYHTLENLVLPLASDGVTVDMMVALTVYHPLPPTGA